MKNQFQFDITKNKNTDPYLLSNRILERNQMSESVYKIIELVGTSTESWEKAAVTAIETAMKTLDDVRIAEVVKQDIQIEDGKILAYRTRLKISFKYHSKDVS